MKQNFYNTRYVSNKKRTSIPSSLIIVPTMILVLAFSFNVYARSEIKSAMEKTEEDVVLPTVRIIEEELPEIVEEPEVQVEPEPEPEPEPVLEVHTAPNGENYTIIGNVRIPSLNIDYPILSSTSTDLLKISVSKYWGADPNEVGNMVVLGHNYKNTKFFSKLPNIQKGEIIEITDARGRTLNYTVYDTFVVDPDDNTCTSQLTDGHTDVTLITCYYNTNGVDRFVVKARAY